MTTSVITESLPYGLRQKLLTSFFIIIATLGGLNIYTLIRITGQDRILSNRVDQQIELHSIHNDIQHMNQNISSYLRSGNGDYLILYRQTFAEISAKLSDLKNLPDETKEILYAFRDIKSMLDTYRNRADKLVQSYDEGQEMIYLRGSEDDLLQLSGFISEEIEGLSALFLDRLQSFFTDFTRQMDRNLKTHISALIIIILFCYILALNFSLSVSKPIHQLALELIKFGRKAEPIDLKEGKRKDEIAVLYRSFNDMAKRISSQIEGIQEKAELVQKLKDQEIQHHRAENLLKESELALLQSQINPHFLFNTLNVINSLSSLEHAPKTGEMIQCLSELLRYNLLNQKSTVPLEDEIDLVTSYIHIQKTRFGDKLSYEQKIDKDCLNISIPAIILQPLLENAVKHGLEPISRPGKVSLTVQKTGSHILIEVTDNGKGITRDRIDEIMDTDRPMESMGIRNVMRRLELRYGFPCFSMKQGDPEGTVCRILIPVKSV